MITKYILSKEGEKKVSEHFKVKEFRCKDGSDFVYIKLKYRLIKEIN